MKNTLTNMGKNVFYYNNLNSVIFYGRSDLTGVTIGESAFGWASGYSNSNISSQN